MIQIEKKTSLTIGEVVNRASSFFGKTGLGLQETARNSCCLSFEGGGGSVMVSVAENQTQRLVTVEGREWEHQIREFVTGL